MPRKLRTPKEKFGEVSEQELHFFSDGLLGEQPGPHDWKIFSLKADPKALAKMWAEHSPAIMPEWIRAHPGSRPSLWWKIDAPECQRLRLGGVGTANHEVLGYARSFHCGIPDSGWVNAFDVAYYNGRAVDVKGNPIGEQYHEGDFAGKPIDPANPPCYESQASYLKRHNLFEPGEERRLRAKDFQPETVSFEEEEQNADRF